MRVLLYSYIILSCLIIPSISQGQFYVTGKIKAEKSGETIPFVHVSSPDSNHTFANFNGRFEWVSGSRPALLKFSHPDYETKIIHLKPGEHKNNNTLPVRLQKKPPFKDKQEDSPNSNSIISKAVKHKKDNRPKNISPISYNTYNKSRFKLKKDSGGSFLTASPLFQSLYKKTLDSSHNTFLFEYATEKNYINSWNQNEKITGVNAGALDFPTLYTISSRLQPFSIYKNYFDIAYQEFISPLAGNPFKRYSFRIKDTVPVEQDSLFIISFYPKKKFLKSLKGTIYIHSKGYGVKYLSARPAKNKAIKLHLAYSSALYNDSLWFPLHIKTTARLEKFSSNKLSVIAEAMTYVRNFRVNDTLSKKDFNEISLLYQENAAHRKEAFWQKRRPLPLTTQEKNIYQHYRNHDALKYFSRILKTGTEIYQGKIPASPLTFKLDRILNYNAHEGLRLGLGVSTSNKFSRVIKPGAFFGYGFRDAKWKYGGNLNIHIFPQNRLDFRIFYKNDLREAASTSFLFDDYQYPSEAIRKYGISTMDRVEQFGLALKSRPFKYSYLGIKWSDSRISPRYPYQWLPPGKEKEAIEGPFHINSLKTTFKLTPGQQEIVTPESYSIIKGNYPRFWLQLEKGFAGNKKNTLPFQRWNAKIEDGFRTLGLGKTRFQLQGGYIPSVVPYTLLFNGKGSLREPSVVIHNSFETMGYKEFVSDRFLSIYLSHNFGKFHTGDPNFQPSLEVLHNMGWGDLQANSEHLKIDYKTMEKGYFESGIFVNDVLIINLFRIKSGIGTGFFYRYGPYADPFFAKNLFFKFSTNFSL